MLKLHRKISTRHFRPERESTFDHCTGRCNKLFFCEGLATFSHSFKYPNHQHSLANTKGREKRENKNKKRRKKFYIYFIYILTIKWIYIYSYTNFFLFPSKNGQILALIRLYAQEYLSMSTY